MADDLFEALKMFSQGVKEYQLQSAIGDANSYVQQIKAADLSEQQKRSELQSLSNQLVGHLAGIGATGTQIQAVAQSVGPKQFATPDQAQLEGFLTGNNDLVKLGNQADIASTANQIRLYEKKAEIDLEKQKRLFDHQEKMGALKGPKAQQGDLEFGTNVQVATQEANKLENLINKFGNFEVMDTKAAAQLQSASYQLAINYAKIVDPASVAREGEVAAAQKYLIPLGLGTRNSVSLEAVKEYKRKIREYVKARANQKNAGGSVAAPAAAPEPTGNSLSKYWE